MLSTADIQSLELRFSGELIVPGDDAHDTARSVSNAAIDRHGREIVRLMSRDFFSDLVLRADMVRFVSVLSQSPRSAPSTPMSFPSSGKWLLRISEGESVRRRAVPAAHGGHQLSRQVGRGLRGPGHHARLEYHHRDR